MSWAVGFSARFPEDHGPAGSHLAQAEAKASFVEDAVERGLLLVDTTPPRDVLRGRLWAWMEGAIERALETNGAMPPRAVAARDRLTADDAREAALADVMRRARSCGASGIALWVSSLSCIASDEGVLDASDSDTLRWWMGASGTRPVSVGFDPENRRLRVYLDPVTIDSLLARHAAETEPPPSAATGSTSDVFAVATADAEEDAEGDADGDGDREEARSSDALELALAPLDAGHGTEFDLSQSARAMAEDLSAGAETDWLREALIELSTPAPGRATVVAEEPAPDTQRGGFSATPAAVSTTQARSERTVEAFQPENATHDVGPAPREELVLAGDSFAGDSLAAGSFDDGGVGALLPPPFRREAREVREVVHEAPVIPPQTAPRITLEFADSARPAPRAELDLDTRRKLEACARELDAANGPKPLGVVERLFQNAYVPIRAALDRGADLPSLRDTADEWAKSFEKSYVDAFDALRVRTKRPTMVVDVPDVALRIARLHGARTTQLLLVDGLRYDLGDLVNERLRAIVGQRAACAERLLMWAALPTTTAAQVELIGRGAGGLRDFTGDVQEDLIVAHGRKASMIRRLKTGQRDVLKLDIVASRLGEPGGVEPEGFPALADEVAQRLAAHFEGQKPRTLVMIFGDHGFTLNHKKDGRTSVREGGASPEEVLVPAFAWLVGAVH